MNLADAISTAANRGRMEFKNIRGEVVSVDKQALTCVVQPLDDDAAEIHDVDLALGIEGIIPIPSVGSLVVVAMENDFTGFLVSTSGLDELRILCDKITFSTNQNSTSTFVVIEHLIQKLNNLENAFNGLLTDYKTHIHNSTAPGSPTSPIVVPNTQMNLQPTQKADIENPNITQ